MKRGALALLVATAGLLGVPPATGAQSGGGVLVIGDSLEVGTGPYLRQELRGVAPLTVDARNGRPSPEGVEVLRSRLAPGHSVIVFDLGVNNDPALPQILASDLQTVRELAGDRCLVVASFVRPPIGGRTIEATNQVVRGFAAHTPGAQLVDWQGAAKADPGLLSPDGVHAFGSGYAVRAKLVAQAVRACLAGGSGTAPSGLPAPRSRPRVPSRPAPSRPAPKPAVPAPADAPLLDPRALGPSPFVAGCLGRAAALMESAATKVGDVVGPPRREPVLGAASGSASRPRSRPPMDDRRR